MTQSVKENLLAAFRYLLKPLVRMAVKNAVAFPEFSEVLKQAYVDVARKQFEDSGKDPTIEGISLIANIEKNQVRDILGSNIGAKFGVAAQESNPLPTALAAWHTDVNYTGPYGVLRDLEFSRGAGEKTGATFSELTSTYCDETSDFANPCLVTVML